MALSLTRSKDSDIVELQFSAFTDTGTQPPWSRFPMPWVVHDQAITSLADLPDDMGSWRWLDGHAAMRARFAVDRILWDMATSAENTTLAPAPCQPPGWLRDAITAAQPRLKDPTFTVSALARLAGCSDNHLNRTVRHTFNRTAQALLRELRINRARHMLTHDPDVQ